MYAFSVWFLRCLPVWSTQLSLHLMSPWLQCGRSNCLSMSPLWASFIIVATQQASLSAAAAAASAVLGHDTRRWFPCAHLKGDDCNLRATTTVSSDAEGRRPLSSSFTKSSPLIKKPVQRNVDSTPRRLIHYDLTLEEFYSYLDSQTQKRW